MYKIEQNRSYTTEIYIIIYINIRHGSRFIVKPIVEVDLSRDIRIVRESSRVKLYRGNEANFFLFDV